ncbi:response regulator transcription factor [Actinokineospora enzanensis]|uniref:response regulator transcription factor n=1 Tax=Actinokineospora enzanensis TaxID=155975 RepID=UPI00036686CC|nr:response regulator transcription factor [Actinokineospora enzanensis]
MTDLVLCDDHAVFADALSAVLVQHGFAVRAVAGTIAGAVAALRALRPDLCLLDRTLADGDAVAALARLAQASSHTRILILTADDDPATATQALTAGAAGYVHKTAGVRTLTRALHRTLAGETVIDLPPRRPGVDLPPRRPGVDLPPRRPGVDLPPRRPNPETDTAHRLAAHLTPRERQCLALLVEGAGTVAMQRRMGISATTVRTHVQSLLTKLGVHSRLEAASFAVRNRLLADPPDHATGT